MSLIRWARQRWHRTFGRYDPDEDEVVTFLRESKREALDVAAGRIRPDEVKRVGLTGAFVFDLTNVGDFEDERERR